MRRRDMLKAGLLAAACPMVFAAEARPASFLKGFNAYYLHQELYGRAEARGFRDLDAVTEDYLHRELGLPELLKTCSFNAVRFWAFNHYPCRGAPQRPSSPACTVRAPGEPNQAALDVLAALMNGLDELGLAQAPVLSNYWLSYGGVVAMLEWAGEVPPGTFADAFCGLGPVGGDELLRRHSADFFAKPTVMEVWRKAVRPVLGILAGRRNLAVVELINEPRGLFPPGGDPAAARAAVAAWMRAQGDFARQALDMPVRLSSGEEGWLAEAPARVPAALKEGGQPWEGVDMLENVRQGGMNAASAHCYLHPAARRTLTNLCGVTYKDERGWAFLLRDPAAAPRDAARAGAEWIASRGEACAGTPWYLGEYGWTRPAPDGSPIVGPSIREERAEVYASWLETARAKGAFGAFVWMPDSPRHTDTFYGLDKEDLRRCFAS